MAEEKKPLSQRLQDVLEGAAADARRRARELVTSSGFTPVSPDLPKEEYREKTLGWIKEMVAQGLTKMPYPVKFGGTEQGVEYMNIVEVIAHFDLSLAIKQGVQFGLFGLSVQSLGTEKHHTQYLPDIMDGKLLGGFAMTELGGGSDVQGVATEAIYDHETRSFTIHTPDDDARKAYIGNAAKHGKMMVVFAQLKMDKDGPSQGVHAFMVPVRDDQGNILPGVSIEDCGHKVGLNGVDNGYISFDQVKVPYDALLDRFASIDESGKYCSDIQKKSQRFFKMISTLVTGRVFVAMAALSGAKNALTSSLKFAENRKVFGDTLLDKQATQTRMLPRLAHAYAMHFATRELLARHGNPTPEVETIAAALKARSSDAALETIDEARKLAGGKGYMSTERYGSLRNDVDIFRTFEGDNTVLRLLVAKNRLTKLAQKFSKASGIEKLAKGAVLALSDKLSRFNEAKSRTDHDHLLSLKFQKHILIKRERAMLYALSQKMMKKGNAAVNDCQDEMLAYAEAYADRLMIESYARVLRDEKDPEVRAVLKDLCSLFALDTMHRNGLWYIENGFMKPGKTKALDDLIHEVQENLRPHVQELVDAFAIPESVLGAPAPAPKKTPKPPSP